MQRRDPRGGREHPEQSSAVAEAGAERKAGSRLARDLPTLVGCDRRRWSGRASERSVAMMPVGRSEGPPMSFRHVEPGRRLSMAKT